MKTFFLLSVFILLGGVPLSAGWNPYYVQEEDWAWRASKWSTTALTILDIDSTIKGIERGARECNPFMNLVADSEKPERLKRWAIGVGINYAMLQGMEYLHQRVENRVVRSVLMGVNFGLALGSGRAALSNYRRY